VSNKKIFRIKNGNYATYYGTLTLDSTSASTWAMNLPSGDVIDYTKISTASQGSQTGTITQNSYTGTNAIYSGNFTAFTFVDGSDTGKVFMAYQMNSSGFIKLVGTGLFVGGYTVTFNFSVPLQ